MQILTTLEELDAKLAECAAAGRISDDELRRVFASFRMDISRSVPPDPFSPEYRNYMMALYQRIAGRPYDVRNEAAPFDTAEADRRPFPYYTGSSKTAGFFLMGTAFLLHSLDLPKGARVVEFGPGWGNTTIWMAMLGYDVTAVDIEPHFCELLERRARRHDVSLTVINDDFMWSEKVTEPFDAAIFFECFHHCSDHNRLLRALDRAVKPGGKVYFAAEPIVPDFPIPWGLRMDGESLWAIRNNGWMELGFNESYFREALDRSGWSARKHVYNDLAWACVWEAQRASEIPAANVRLELAAAYESISQRISKEQIDPIAATAESSTGWKIIKPLRLAKQLLPFIVSVLLIMLRPVVRRCFEIGLAFVRRHRRWALPIRRLLAHFPRLQAHLYRLAYRKDRG
jgi:SAM-dependent methyltransferase